MQEVTQRLRLEDGTIKEFKIKRYVPGEEDEIEKALEGRPVPDVDLDLDLTIEDDGTVS